MTLSNKRLLLALALFAPDEVVSFAIPSLIASASIATACQRTASVAHGDDCSAMAKRCNVSHDALLKFNPDDGFCSKLRIGQLVCCGKGMQSRSPVSAKNNSQDDSQTSDDSNEEPEDSGDDDQESNRNDPDSNSDGNSSSSDDTPQQNDGDKNDNDNKNDDGSKDSSNDDQDPDADLNQGHRTGNWTKVTCNDRAVRDKKLPPDQKWGQLGAAAAFQDAVDFYKSTDRDAGTAFAPSIMSTLNGPGTFTCDQVFDETCSKIAVCPDYNQNGTGPAGMLIQNSFVNIHSVREASQEKTYTSGRRMIC